MSKVNLYHKPIIPVDILKMLQVMNNHYTRIAYDAPQNIIFLRDENNISIKFEPYWYDYETQKMCIRATGDISKISSEFFQALSKHPIVDHVEMHKGDCYVDCILNFYEVNEIIESTSIPKEVLGRLKFLAKHASTTSLLFDEEDETIRIDNFYESGVRHTDFTLYSYDSDNRHLYVRSYNKDFAREMYEYFTVKGHKFVHPMIVRGYVEDMEYSQDSKDVYVEFVLDLYPKEYEDLGKEEPLAIVVNEPILKSSEVEEEKDTLPYGAISFNDWKGFNEGIELLKRLSSHPDQGILGLSRYNLKSSEVEEEKDTLPYGAISFNDWKEFNEGIELLKRLSSHPDQGILWLNRYNLVCFTKLSEMLNGEMIAFTPNHYSPGNHLFQVYTDDPDDLKLLKHLTYYNHLHKLGKWCAGAKYNEKENKFTITIDLGLVYRL